ncbi:MAG: type III-B CRISPR module RAMP protein Cmr6 [Planctomycetota bacterium]
MAIPLPQSVASLVTRHRSEAHPLLLLDKHIEGWEYGTATGGKFGERIQKRAAIDVARGCLSPLQAFDFGALSKRWHETLEALEASTFCCTTTGPLSVHLTRTSVLENAGVCLHGVYGFACLPGSGLKGMARAYACEIWLRAQADGDKAWALVSRVFGWASSPWLRDLAARLEVDAPAAECRGSIIFHDAWPVCNTSRPDKGWPALLVDIVNNHHPNYYEAAPDDEAHPPGDWENPNPVYFLMGSSTRRTGRRRKASSTSLTAWMRSAMVNGGVGTIWMPGPNGECTSPLARRASGRFARGQDRYARG